MSNPIGRPMKYDRILTALDNEEIYSPAAIARFARDHGFLKGDEATIRLDMQRIRIALGRLSNNRSFPDEGDGLVAVKGQKPIPGWYGSRWKRAVSPPAPLRRVAPEWDANMLLAQKGLFLLREVVTLLPLKTGQLRYRATVTEGTGISKDEALNAYVVDMEQFSKWIIHLWKGE